MRYEGGKNVLEKLESRQMLSAGDLDPAFGSGGLSSPLGGLNNPTFITSRVLSSGKILAVGTIKNNPSRDLLLVRYNANGALDMTFGGGDGIVTMNVNGDDAVGSMALRTDGKILIGLSGEIVRFNSDGTLDSGFSNMGVRMLGGSLGSQIAVLSDNRIVYGDASTVALLTPGGSKINTWAGVNLSSLSGYRISPTLNQIVMLSGDKVLLGCSATPTGSGLAIGPTLVQLKADGSLDSSFGNGGISDLVLEDASGFTEGMGSFTQLSNGKIMALGSYDDGHSVLVRLDSDGSFDATFGVEGKSGIKLAVDNSASRSARLVVQSDGKLIVAATYFQDNTSNLNRGITVRRFNADGSQDSSFSYDSSTRIATDEIPLRPNLSLGIAAGNRLIVAANVVPAPEDTTDTLPLLASFQLDQPTGSFAHLTTKGTLSLQGDAGVDNFKLTLSSDGSDILVTSDFASASFQLSQVKRIGVDAAGGDDVIDSVLPRSQTLLGGNGNDLIISGKKKDSLVGGAGNDNLSAGAGDDVLEGNSGNDQLFGEAGNDALNGGSGNDQLFGGDGNDALFGQEGNDTLDGGAGNDQLNGNTGDDHLNGGAGLNTLAGNAGNDWLDYYGETGGRFSISTNESAQNEPEGYTIERKDIGTDYFAPEETLRVLLTPEKDRLSLEITGAAYIDAAGGNDVIGGGALTWGDASITVMGGNGNDLIDRDEASGLEGIYGGAGDDMLVSRSKKGFSDAGPGFDTEDLTYQSATIGGSYTLGKNVERFLGTSAENLTIYGNELDNIIYVRRVAQTVFGGDGNDEIIVDGPDANAELTIELHGGKGNDKLTGSDNNAEVLFGDEGDDILIGNAGADTLDGGSGNDSSDNDSADVVTSIEHRNLG